MRRGNVDAKPKKNEGGGAESGNVLKKRQKISLSTSLLQTPFVITIIEKIGLVKRNQITRKMYLRAI